MHPRNPYLIPPDFLQLAESYPLLKPFVYLNKNAQPSINFKDAAVQRYLTEALLHRDFGLEVELPPNRLCPAVPNRLNYVLWIQDILVAASQSNPTASAVEEIRGIDIGTGASVIYPLLACAMSSNWSFVATDIDRESLIVADKNIARNGLQNRIILAAVEPNGRLLFEDNSVLPRCDFLMCNPPFYASKEEVVRASEDKEFDPSAVCTGADVEMITSGGEVGFIQRIVEESLLVGTRCRFYTSLLGKHSTITAIVDVLKSHKIENYGLTEFVQGQTRRWGIVWSLGEERLPDSLVRSTSESLHSLLPLPNTYRQPWSAIVTRSQDTLIKAIATLGTLARELEGVTFIQMPVSPGSLEAFARVIARENTWSRKARRKLEKLRKENREMSSAHSDVTQNPALSLTIRCYFLEETVSPEPNKAPSLVLQATWTRGKDRELFETFWSHLSRKFTDHVKS